MMKRSEFKFCDAKKRVALLSLHDILAQFSPHPIFESVSLMKRPRPQTNFSTRHLSAIWIKFALGHTLFLNYIFIPCNSLLLAAHNMCSRHWSQKIIVPSQSNVNWGSDDSAKWCIVPCGQDTQRREEGLFAHLFSRCAFSDPPAFVGQQGVRALLVQIHNGIYRAHHARSLYPHNIYNHSTKEICVRGDANARRGSKSTPP